MKLGKIITLGDSIMKSVIMDAEAKKYTISDNSIAEICGHRLGADISDYSRFGSTISVGNTFIIKHISQIGESNYTLLEFGGNDCDFDWKEIAQRPDANHQPHTPLTIFSAVYKEIIGKIRTTGSSPILLSLPPLNPEKFFRHITSGMEESGVQNVLKWLGGRIEYIGDWHETYNLQIFKIGSALDTPVIDISTAFLQEKNKEKLLCEDGIHPNEAGQAIIADRICNFFSSLIDQNLRASTPANAI